MRLFYVVKSSLDLEDENNYFFCELYFITLEESHRVVAEQ